MEHPFHDFTITDAFGEVAVRDFPDNGQPLVLLHGAGLNLCSWDAVVSGLADRFHVIAVDLLGHGASRVPANFSIEADLAALKAVTTHFDLASPAIVGHSYGGMVAVRYAIDHPGCSVVVNVDGISNGCIEHYAGKSAEEVRAYWQQSDEALESAPAVEATGPTLWRDAEVAKAPELARALGLEVGPLTTMMERTFQRTDEDQWEARPTTQFSQDMMRQLAAYMPFANYAEASSPTVLVLAVKDALEDGVEADFQRAHRVGLSAAFEELARENPHLQLRKIDSAHLVPLESPTALAELIIDIIDG